MVLVAHVSALGWQAYRDSATWDEVGHFAAGMTHWRHGRFDMYQVNPPLVRLLACAPVALLNPDIDVPPAPANSPPGTRPEFVIGERMARSLGQKYFWYLTTARWACIPLSVLGACVCYLWARELYGETAGVCALCLWAFSPTVLGWAHVITPDVGAAAFGVAASYQFWRWSRSPSWRSALVAGLLL